MKEELKKLEEVVEANPRLVLKNIRRERMCRRCPVRRELMQLRRLLRMLDERLLH